MAINIHFDFLAPVYERFIRPPDPQRVIERLNLPAEGRLLDVGGGTGRVARALTPLVEGLVISDLSYKMLSQGRRAQNGSRPWLGCQSRAERLPYPDDWFPRILVVDAFHHFSDQPGALREFARVLAPGGRLVIEEPDIRRFSVKLIAAAELVALMDSHFRKPDEIARMAAVYGLTTWVEIDGATAWVIAEKPRARDTEPARSADEAAPNPAQPAV